MRATQGSHDLGKWFTGEKYGNRKWTVDRSGNGMFWEYSFNCSPYGWCK